MSYESKVFTSHISRMLELAQNTLATPADLSAETGAINVHGDSTLEVDAAVEEKILAYVKGQGLPVEVYSEEIGRVRFHPNPTHRLDIDPLDGSTNYKVGRGVWPYGVLLAISKSLEPQVGDVIIAGALEFTHAQRWVYDGEQTFDGNGSPTRIPKTTSAITASTPVCLNLYTSGYETFLPLAGKVFPRNTGAAVGNLACVLAQAAPALGDAHMKAEEIGAVHALLKGAGARTCDLRGNSIERQHLEPGRRYGLLAGDEAVVAAMVTALNAR